ncbi:MAG: DUF1080 domain-containing protein [Verrucomicrobiales bacterium]|nr:DUF1080 domain-containing protein [Verrucomicrobiales bacterium]MCP5559743.1 DUF1080 domain-containing protein [Verrucomicrobiaceae bacterium]
MKLPAYLIALSLAFSLQAEDLHPAADAAGFVPMFNGKDLTGWKTTGNWLVEADGSVALHPREGETGWQRWSAYLATEKKYQDFVLDLEFKFEPTGNSGVFMRIGDLGEPVKTGFEVQILDTYGLEKPGHHDCGGIVRCIGPTKNMVKPAGEWNRYTITVKGRQVKVVFNGEQVIDVNLDDSEMKSRPSEGFIAFQDEAKRVSYRNVRIKELK